MNQASLKMSEQAAYGQMPASSWPNASLSGLCQALSVQVGFQNQIHRVKERPVSEWNFASLLPCLVVETELIWLPK